jgi:Tol biopolymer transport system component
MTLEQRLERDLPQILDEIATGPYPDYIDDVLSSTAARRQRPTWTFPERWLPMAEITSRSAFAPHLPWRTIVLALLVLALLAGVAVLYVGTHPTRLPAPFGPAANGFISYEDHGDIYVGDPVTGATRLVVGGPEEDVGPGYSADGTWIGFLRNVSSTEFDIYVIRPDGSELRRLTSEPISNEAWVQWSPDSRHLATIWKNQLDLIDLAGNVRTIASIDGMDYVQFRPPDAGELLYRARVDGRWGLFAMDADGSNRRTIVAPTVPIGMDAAFANASYAPDGGSIFFQMYTSDASNGDPGCCHLFVVNADGSNLHKFVPNPGEGTWDGSPSVSPDGTWVAFWHNLPDRAIQHVAVTRADGTGPIVETGPDLSSFAHWVWAPDSSKILMFPDVGNNAYVLDPAGGPWSTVPWSKTGDLDWQRVALPSS